MRYTLFCNALKMKHYKCEPSAPMSIMLHYRESRQVTEGDSNYISTGYYSPAPRSFFVVVSGKQGIE